MTYNDEIIESIDALKKAEESRKCLVEKYSDNPGILAFFLPSTDNLIQQLKERIDGLINEYTGYEIATPDVWIRLQGPAFENGRAPLGIVGAFIKKLMYANQHAVTLLEQVKYEGKRINKKMRELAELELVATAPGSLKLGVSKMPAHKFYPGSNMDQEILLLDDTYELLAAAEKDSQKSIEGIQLLSRVLISTTNEEEYKNLLSELKDEKNLLKLLHYAREIAPAQSSEIETITITGNKSIGCSIDEVVISKQTRIKLKEMSNRILGNDKYIDGYGTVRMVDLDKLSFRIDSMRCGKDIYEGVECKLNPNEFNEIDIESIANKMIKLSGILSATKVGKNNVLDVDKIFFEDEDQSDDFM